MSLLASFKAPGPNGLGYGTSAEQATSGLALGGRTYLVTGCNSGLGLETLRVLGLRGATIIAAARTLGDAQAALERTGATGMALACDLSEPASLRAAVARVKEQGRPLDALVCNAGIMALPRLQVKHGLELQFLTNHVGHFQLVLALLSELAPAGRVVVVSSEAHRSAPAAGIDFDNLDGSRGYAPWQNYGQSKLANLLFARQLARRLAGSARTVNALHPGVIATNLGRHMNPFVRALLKVMSPLVLKSVAQGAATQCYLAASPALASVSGAYFADCNPAQPSALALDDALAERLWQTSEEIAARLN